VLARLAAGTTSKSPFTHQTSGRKINVTFEQKTTYELDGGERGTTKKLKVRVAPGAVTICVPEPPNP